MTTDFQYLYIAKKYDDSCDKLLSIFVIQTKTKTTQKYKITIHYYKRCLKVLEIVTRLKRVNINI